MDDAKTQLRAMLQGTLAANPKEAVFMLALGREAAEALATDEPQGTWLDRLTAERAELGARMERLDQSLHDVPADVKQDTPKLLLMRHQLRLMKSLHETLSARLRLAGEEVAEEWRSGERDAWSPPPADPTAPTPVPAGFEERCARGIAGVVEWSRTVGARLGIEARMVYTHGTTMVQCTNKSPRWLVVRDQTKVRVIAPFGEVAHLRQGATFLAITTPSPLPEGELRGLL